MSQVLPWPSGAMPIANESLTHPWNQQGAMFDLQNEQLRSPGETPNISGHVSLIKDSAVV